MLEVADIHTYYGDSHVLQGVSLNVPEGKVVGLLGRNGVGKTTTVGSIVGFTAPRSGRVLFRGADITRSPSYEIARLGVGLAPQGRRIFASLLVHEHLSLGANVQNGAAWTLSRVYEFFPRLAERRKQRARSLSGGEQSMLSIARALMTNPVLLIMDEPTEGLSPVLVEQVAEVIKALKSEGQSILLVEQNFSLALDICEHAYILNKGAVVFDGPMSSLLADESIQARYLGV